MCPNPENEPHRGSYRDIVTHKLMLQDVVRTSCYADAIHAAVGPGKRVIDFGSGTGTLAIFAARAGASVVYAIERTPIVEHAREIARRSGQPNIAFHRGDQRSFSCDGPVDVIVSEWMGHFLFYESMLEPLIELRDRWLAPGGIMIPERVSLRAALVIDERLYEDDSFLEQEPYGIDYSPIADLPLRQSRLVDLEEHQVMMPYISLGSLDLGTIGAVPESFHGSCVVGRDVTVYGIAGWFDARLVPGVEFGTGPGAAPTHWRPVYFPLPEPFDCISNRTITLHIAPPRNVELPEPTWAWSITDGQTTLGVDERETFERCLPWTASDSGA